MSDTISIKHFENKLVFGGTYDQALCNQNRALADARQKEKLMKRVILQGYALLGKQVANLMKRIAGELPDQSAEATSQKAALHRSPCAFSAAGKLE